MNNESGLINIPQARRLRNNTIPYETIYRAAKDGRIEGAFVHPLGNRWVFPQEAFISWAETQHRPQRRGS